MATTLDRKAIEAKMLHQPGADRLGDAVHTAEGAEDGRAGAGRAAASEAGGVSRRRF